MVTGLLRAGFISNPFLPKPSAALASLPEELLHRDLQSSGDSPNFPLKGTPKRSLYMCMLVKRPPGGVRFDLRRENVLEGLACSEK